MTMLVTLQQAKDHLRVDFDAEDSDITLKIHAASGVVIRYLKLPSAYFADLPALTTDTPFEIQAAVLIMLGILYRDRDGTEMDKWEHGYLPFPVTSLLYTYRDPALA